MGQQQVFLIIIATVIVGIATFVAISTLNDSTVNSNVNAVHQDMVDIATSAETYYYKPKMLGGGGNSYAGLTFNALSIPLSGKSSDGMVGWNDNGTYFLSNAGQSSFRLVSHPLTAAGAVQGEGSNPDFYFFADYSPGKLQVPTREERQEEDEIAQSDLDGSQKENGPPAGKGPPEGKGFRRN